jgi:hypothetical protein
MDTYLEQIEAQQSRFFKQTLQSYTNYSKEENISLANACVFGAWFADVDDPSLEINVNAGQVRQTGTKKLVGYVQNDHFCVKVNGVRMPRGRLILRCGKRDRVSEAETVDHLDFRRPFDDRIKSIDWSSKSIQAINRRNGKGATRKTKPCQSSKHEDFSVVEAEFGSVAEAAELLKLNPNTLSAAMSRGRQAGGFYWRRKPPVSLPGETWKRVSTWRDEAIVYDVCVSDIGRVDITSSRQRTVGYGIMQKTSGYMVCQLGTSSGIKQIYVHQLVCTAFHGEKPPDKDSVDHINRNRVDNRATNLAWANWYEQISNRTLPP